MSALRVVVAEPNPSGHRFAYVRRLLPALAALGADVTFATSPAGLASPEYQVQLADIDGLSKVAAILTFDPQKRPSHSSQAFAAELAALPGLLGADHVLVPYADGAMQMAGLRRMTGRFRVPSGVEFEALLMRAPFADAARRVREAARSRAWIILTASAPFRTVHHLDPFVVAALWERAPALARRMTLVADPVEPFESPTRQEARRILGIPEGGRYIGCVGPMDLRKGIDLLIEAFTAAALASNDRLLLAGAQHPEIRARLAGLAAPLVRQGRIQTIDRYLDEQEMRTAIAAMDLVCTPYPPTRGHSGSSSLVIHAASQDRFVLGEASGWIGRTIDAFGLGATCRVIDQPEFAKAIATSLDDAAGYRLTPAGQRLVFFHSPGNFVAAMTRRVRQRMSLPPPDGEVDWAWVMEAAPPIARDVAGGCRDLAGSALETGSGQ